MTFEIPKIGNYCFFEPLKLRMESIKVKNPDTGLEKEIMKATDYKNRFYTKGNDFDEILANLKKLIPILRSKGFDIFIDNFKVDEIARKIQDPSFHYHASSKCFVNEDNTMMITDLYTMRCKVKNFDEFQAYCIILKLHYPLDKYYTSYGTFYYNQHLVSLAFKILNKNFQVCQDPKGGLLLRNDNICCLIADVKIIKN